MECSDYVPNRTTINYKLTGKLGGNENGKNVL